MGKDAPQNRQASPQPAPVYSVEETDELEYLRAENLRQADEIAEWKRRWASRNDVTKVAGPVTKPLVGHETVTKVEDVTKVGRPAVTGVAMTAAERKRRSRQKVGVYAS